MPGGIIILALSAVYSLFLIIKVESILGQRFIIITGDNIWNARGIQISDTTYIILWIIALAGFSFGGWLIFSDLRDKKSSSTRERSDIKKCPKCAETIKLEAKVCRHCGHEFSEREIEEEKEKQRKLVEQDEFALKKIPELRLLQIAYDYQYNQNNLTKAKYYLERLLREFPDGEYMGIAKDRINEIQKSNPHLSQVVTSSIGKSAFPSNLAPNKWIISGLSGPLAGKDVELTAAPLIIGRDPEESNLILPPTSQFISKQHCVIRFDDERRNILIEDLGSKNGTFFYGGKRLDAGRSYLLENGDRFYLAEPDILFELQSK